MLTDTAQSSEGLMMLSVVPEEEALAVPFSLLGVGTASITNSAKPIPFSLFLFLCKSKKPLWILVSKNRY